MPPDRECFTPINLPRAFSLPPCMDFFTLGAGPNTDLWRKPPDRDTATAPIIYTSLRQPFIIAEVTVSADWEMEWDQGGLVIFAGAPPRQRQPPRDSETDSRGTRDTQDDIDTTTTNNNNNNNSRNPNDTSGTPEPPPPYPHILPRNGTKWVKAGLEFSANTVNASSVSATADGADWCLSPLAPSHVPLNAASSAPITSLRIKLERIGHALWVWYQIPSAVPDAQTETRRRTPSEISSSWRKLREVTWFFWGVEDKSVHVGVYASRPASFSMNDTAWAARGGRRFAGGSNSAGDVGGGGDRLVVEFEDLEIF